MGTATVIVLVHVQLGHMNKVLDFGCKCFNVLHNMIFLIGMKMIKHSLPNSLPLVKEETPLVWTNSLVEVTNQDGHSLRPHLEKSRTSAFLPTADRYDFSRKQRLL